VDGYSRRNTFEVPSRAAVALGGDARGNQVVALADGTDEIVPPLWRSGVAEGRRFRQTFDAGTRRMYVDPDASGSLLNLGMCNVLELPDSREGDVALHDGSGFADELPRLAVYTGGRWLFFSPSAEQPQALVE
jgi:hypothetical protein